MIPWVLYITETRKMSHITAKIAFVFNEFSFFETPKSRNDRITFPCKCLEKYCNYVVFREQNLCNHGSLKSWYDVIRRLGDGNRKPNARLFFFFFRLLALLPREKKKKYHWTWERKTVHTWAAHEGKHFIYNDMQSCRTQRTLVCAYSIVHGVWQNSNKNVEKKGKQKTKTKDAIIYKRVCLFGDQKTSFWLLSRAQCIFLVTLST